LGFPTDSSRKVKGTGKTRTEQEERDELAKWHAIPESLQNIEELNPLSTALKRKISSPSWKRL
jgi:hypothetical protein